MEYITVHLPPLVTYAMFSEFRRKDKKLESAHEVSRPLRRTTEIAERQETGKPPQLLNFIAKKEAQEELPDVKKRKNLKNFVRA